MLLGSILLFALYHFINKNLGVEKLGVWAIVLSTVSVSRLIDLGLSAGVTRFVASSLARGDFKRAAEVIDTAFLTIWVAVGLSLPVIYFIVKYALPWFLSGEELFEAINILPHALFCLWLTVGSSVFLSGITGCERMDIQASIVIASQTLLLILAILLVPTYGLSGLAYAQLGQVLFTFFVGRLLLCYVLAGIYKLPRSWSKPIFKEILSYGVNVQLANMAMLVFDTSAKLMMAWFGGSAAVGFFEMVSQLVMRVRMVIVSANQAVIPHVARINEYEQEKIYDFYKANIQILLLVAPPIFALLISWSGAFSWLFLGSFQAQFISYLWIVSLAWFFNIFAVPAYFINMGTGEIKWNTYAHITMAIANLVIGYILGKNYGAIGVVLSFAVSMIIGSALLIYVFGKKNRKINILKDGENFGAGIANTRLIFVCLATVVISWFYPINEIKLLSIANLFYFILVPIIFLFLIYVHPRVREISLRDKFG
jgi:O-antigen/teichoic acid export membrane protein